MHRALKNLCDPGKKLKDETPAANEIIDLLRTCTAGPNDAQNTAQALASHFNIGKKFCLSDHLLSEAKSDAGGRDFSECQNHKNLKVITAVVESSSATSMARKQFQFVRHSYVVMGQLVHILAGNPVTNFAMELKDSWRK